MQGYTYFFLFLLQNIDCGYSAGRGGSNVYPQSVLSKNKKNIKKNSAENFQFLKLKKSLFIAWASFLNVFSQTEELADARIMLSL